MVTHNFRIPFESIPNYPTYLFLCDCFLFSSSTPARYFENGVAQLDASPQSLPLCPHKLFWFWFITNPFTLQAGLRWHFESQNCQSDVTTYVLIPSVACFINSLKENLKCVYSFCLIALIGHWDISFMLAGYVVSVSLYACYLIHVYLNVNVIMNLFAALSMLICSCLQSIRWLLLWLITMKFKLFIVVVSSSYDLN